MYDELGVTPLKVNKDDRGSLYEVIHDIDIPQFGQQYVVTTRAAGTIRAFHRHAELWDWFTIIKGCAKFIIVGPEGVPHGPSTKHIFILDGSQPEVLTVPPGYWHGWQALEDNTILSSMASHKYNKENPDEERVLPHSFRANWTIQCK